MRIVRVMTCGSYANGLRSASVLPSPPMISLRALAITSDKRSPLLPDVPTMEESGIKGVTVYSWQAFAAPKGLPADIKSKLHAAIVAGLLLAVRSRGAPMP